MTGFDWRASSPAGMVEWGSSLTGTSGVIDHMDVRRGDMIVDLCTGRELSGGVILELMIGTDEVDGRYRRRTLEEPLVIAHRQQKLLPQMPLDDGSRRQFLEFFLDEPRH